jgi:hypothetical protein
MIDMYRLNSKDLSISLVVFKRASFIKIEPIQFENFSVLIDLSKSRAFSKAIFE